MKSVVRIIVVAAVFACLGWGVAGARAEGVFSSTVLGTGNQDANIGLDTNKTYVNAVNLNGGALNINNVGFTASSGGNPFGTGWAFTGIANQHASDTTIAVAGTLSNLLFDFIYNGNPGTNTLSNLTVGETYVLTYYNRSWDPAGGRWQNVTSSDGASALFDENMGAAGRGTGNLLRYTFTATSTTHFVRFAPVGAATMHLYGFSTEQTFNNLWNSGTDWSTASWSKVAPSNQGANASFAGQAAPTSINLDADRTVGHVQFAGTNEWTLSSGSGRTLTLLADAGGVAVLSASNGSHTISTAISLGSDAVKLGAGTLNVSGAISGSKGLNVNAGLLVLSGANTFGGGVRIGAGTLQVGNGGSGATLGSGPVTNQGSLVFDHSDTQTVGGVISGTGTLAKAGSGTLILTAANTHSGGTLVSGGTLQLNNQTAGGALGSGPVTNKATLAFRATNLVTIANAISDTGALIQSPPASYSATILELSGSNSYSGGTTISNGAVRARNASAFGTGTVTIQSNGMAMLWWNTAGSSNMANDFVLGSMGGNASGDAERKNAIHTDGATGGHGTYTLSGTITLSADSSIGTYGDGVNNNHLTISGKITGSGGLSKGVGRAQEGATLMLSNTTNDYAGDTTVRAGTLKLGASGVIPDGVGKGNLVIVTNANAAGVFDLAGFSETVNGLSGNGRVNNSSTNAGVLTVGNSDATGAANSFTGVIQNTAGSLTLIKTGTGTLTLSGANTYTGSTTIVAGTLTLGGAGQLGGGAYAGAITNNGSLIHGSTPAQTLSGVISGTGSLAKSGGGTLTVSGANTFTGGTTISNGLLAVVTREAVAGGASALGLAASNHYITVNNGGTLGGTQNNWLDSTGCASGGANAHTVIVNAGGTVSNGAGVITGLGNITLNGGRLVCNNGYIGGGYWNGAYTMMGNLTVGGSSSSPSTIEKAAGASGATYVQMSNGGNGVNGIRTMTVDDVTGNPNSDLIVSAPLIDGTMIKRGAGTVELASGAGAGASTVGWKLDAGTLKTTAAGVMGTGRPLTVNGGTLDLRGNDVSVGSLNGGGGTITDHGTALAAPTMVTVSQTTHGVFGGTLADGSGGQKVGLIKTGAATLTLAGTNAQAYGGPTVVAAGTLRLSRVTAAPEGAVAHYNFEGATSDASGNGHTGTLLGSGAGYVAGRSAGQALNLTGSQSVEVPYAADFGLNSFSVSAWVNLNAAPGTYGILGTRFGSENTFDVKVRATNVHGDVGNGAAWLSTTVDFNYAMPVGEWHMITYAVDRDAQQVRMYLDGALTNTLSVNGVPLFMKAGQTLRIGDCAASSPEPMNGKLDDVYVFGSALTPTQIGQLYAAGAAGLGTNLLPTTSVVSIQSGAALDLGGVVQTLAGLSDYSGGGGLVTNGYAAPLTLTLNTPAGTNVTFGGVIADGGAGNAVTLLKDGPGTQVLAGANVFSGGTTISNGVLRIGAGGTSGSIGSMVNYGTVVFDRTDTNTHSGVISGSGAVVKEQANTLVLAADSSAFTGGTAVSNGTLSVNGQLGGLITVYSNATLGGVGTVREVTVAEFGILAPGNSAGVLTASEAVTLQSNAVLSIELGEFESDQLVMSGNTLTLHAGAMLNVSFLPDGTVTNGSTFAIVSGWNTGAFTIGGEVKTNDMTFAADGKLLRINYVQDGGGENITLTVIPEPATVGLLGVCVIAALLRRRFRA